MSSRPIWNLTGTPPTLGRWLRALPLAWDFAFLDVTGWAEDWMREHLFNNVALAGLLSLPPGHVHLDQRCRTHEPLPSGDVHVALHRFTAATLAKLL